MEKRLCPSARCEDGSELIGIVQAGGRVGFVRPSIPVDEEFVAEVSGSQPEKRFRFASNCVENGCVHWSGSKCKIADRMMEVSPQDVSASGLPACAIRARCRWFSQIGKKACRICPLIVTDMNPQSDAT